MGGRGNTGNRNAETTQAEAPKTSWRDENPKFREKTLGGVYFDSSPNSLWGETINRGLYRQFPNYVKKAVLMTDVSHTMDGDHYSLYFVNKQGDVDYIDEYGKGDFMYAVRSLKDEYGDMNDYKKKWNQVGDKLERKENK